MSLMIVISQESKDLIEPILGAMSTLVAAFVGAWFAIVTKLPRFISKLPSPSNKITRRSGRPSANPNACEEP